ncbi:MAG TPA: hypothetical protein VHL54_02765 [Actinomycetota bacterium]|nr:hypothetical protein [Actinomycetota bacterium]
MRLQEELLEGRVRLAPESHGPTHAPGDPPAILKDRHSRVLQRWWLDPTYNPNLHEAAQPAR